MTTLFLADTSAYIIARPPLSQHRAAGVMDLLTAAAAEHYGATVLHYDADFDHIAAVTGQPVEWIIPRGSLP